MKITRVVLLANCARRLDTTKQLARKHAGPVLARNMNLTYSRLMVSLVVKRNVVSAI